MTRAELEEAKLLLQHFTTYIEERSYTDESCHVYVHWKERWKKECSILDDVLFELQEVKDTIAKLIPTLSDATAQIGHILNLFGPEDRAKIIKATMTLFNLEID